MDKGSSRKEKSGSISGKSRVDTALWELAEILAEIAASASPSASEAHKYPLTNSTAESSESLLCDLPSDDHNAQCDTSE